MHLNESLHLVLPVRVDDEGNPLIRAYHVPVSREVFELNYRTLAATKARLASKGIMYQMDAGPRIAAMVLRDEGKRDAEERGEVNDDGSPRDGGAAALLSEFKRLTTILAPTQSGWDNLPVDAAIGRGVIDAEEWQDTLSAICFFTCHYALARKSERQRIAEATASLLTGSITSLDITGLTASWQTSTPTATLTVQRSSIPS